MYSVILAENCEFFSEPIFTFLCPADGVRLGIVKTRLTGLPDGEKV